MPADAREERPTPQRHLRHRTSPHNKKRSSSLRLELRARLARSLETPLPLFGVPPEARTRDPRFRVGALYRYQFRMGVEQKNNLNKFAMAARGDPSVLVESTGLFGLS